MLSVHVQVASIIPDLGASGTSFSVLFPFFCLHLLFPICAFCFLNYFLFQIMIIVCVDDRIVTFFLFKA